MKYILTVTAAIALSVFSFAQSSFDCRMHDHGSASREHSIDISRMKLVLSFEPKAGLVKGKVTHYFTPVQKNTDSIFFDGPGIKIISASLNGKNIEFKTGKEGVTVFPKPALNWGSKDSIVFVYEAKPKKGLYFIGWNDDENISRKQIWTQGQGIDNRHWIPSYDYMNDKMITETIVTFDKKYNVLSNGKKLSEKENNDGTKTWHYRMTYPHSSYLVMLGIGNYEVRTTKSKRGTLIHNWYYPEFPEKVEPTFIHTEKMIDFHEDETGIPYPWEAYSQLPVQDFMYGAMENTTATVFGDFLFIDSRAFLDRNYIATNAHEITHQWFGDLITARSYRDTWLQESFATHYSKHFRRLVLGEDVFQWERRQELNQVLEDAKTNNNPIAHSQAGRVKIYPKGSLVIDMMRDVLGEEQYKRGINYFLKKYSYKNADTHEFMLAFMDTLGVNLEWFFNQWLYRGGEPEFTVRYEDIVSVTDNSRSTRLTAEQTHEVNELTGYFRAPVSVRVFYNDGSDSEVKVWIEKQQETIVVPNPEKKKIDFVLFDPNAALVKKVIFNKSTEELRAQAMKAPGMIDRYDALVALRAEDIQNKRELLIEVYGKETFFATKNEIIQQLAKDENALSIALIRNALEDKDPKVRLAAVQSVDKMIKDFLPGFEKALQDSSYEIIENALIKLCNLLPDNSSRYLALAKDIRGVGNSVKARWLEIAARTEPEKFIPELVKLSDPNQEFRTRANAFNSLQRLDYLDEKVADNLLQASLHFNGRLSGPAISVMEYFMKQSSGKEILSRRYLAMNVEESQKDLLNKYFR